MRPGAAHARAGALRHPPARPARLDRRRARCARRSGRGVKVRLLYNVDIEPAAGDPSAAEHAARDPRTSCRSRHGRPRGPGPDAPQVRRPRRRGGVDRLDELDDRLVDPRGERRLAIAWREALAGAYPRNFEELWEPPGRRALGLRRPRSRSSLDGARPCGPGSRPGTGPSSRSGSRRRSARARERVRIASPVITSAPILGTLAELGERAAASTSPGSSTSRRPMPSSASGQQNGRRTGRSRCSPKALSLLPFSGKPSTPWGPETRPRLHARQGHGRRRHRLRRLVQPLALGRDERRERARDPRPGARRPDGRVRRRDPRPLPATAVIPAQSDGDDLLGVVGDLG